MISKTKFKDQKKLFMVFRSDQIFRFLMNVQLSLENILKISNRSALIKSTEYVLYTLEIFF